MVRLQFEWVEPLELVPSGYDLGHMTFVGDKGSCTSKGKTPDQAMMLILSFSDLLYGLRRIATQQLDEYMFVGTDSSFIVKFRATSKGHVTVKCRDVIIDEVEIDSLCRSVLSDVQAFMARPENLLPEDDLGQRDLAISIASLVQAIAR